MFFLVPYYVTRQIALSWWFMYDPRVILRRRLTPARENGTTSSTRRFNMKVRSRGKSRMWFMHDGAPPYLSVTAGAFWNEQFGNKWTGKGAQQPCQPWPPTSPDLNPIDFFLYRAFQYINLQGCSYKWKTTPFGLISTLGAHVVANTGRRGWGKKIVVHSKI